MDKKPVYLIMVNPDNNGVENNKIYNMTPISDSEFEVEYGRVGGHMTKKTYPMSKWNSQLSSKLKKGYKDVSDLKQDIIEDAKIETPEENQTTDKFSLVKNISVRNILKRLSDFANKTIQASYKVTANQVTQAMVDKAQNIIDDISINADSMSVEDFNNKLLELFTIIPRKMRGIKGYLAKEKKDFSTIIDKEQSLLDTMAGQVYIPKSKREEENDKVEPTSEAISILDEMGIEMRETTPEEVSMLKKLMGDSSNKYYASWAVINKEAEENFQAFMKKNKIKEHSLLCHGSRNQNWFNIIKMSLKIRPSGAIHTGSLLGDALYFSNPDNYHGGVIKSVRYSSNNGYWTGEHQDCGFIAFFEVATGKRYDIYNFDSHYYSYNLKKLQEDCPGAWSLHLHGAGHGGASTVINDEITVYDANQVSIRYLVEIR